MKWKVSFAEVVTLEQRPDWQEEVRQVSIGGRAPQGRSSRCCTQRRFARVSTRNKVRMAGAQRDSSAGNESEKSKKGSCRNRQECVGIVQARNADLWAGGGNRDGAEYLAFRARAFIDF